MSKSQTPRYTTTVAVLAAAIDAADKIPTNHLVSEPRFGTYAERVGGGYYFTLTVYYSVSADPERDARPSIEAARRREKVIEAWTEEFVAKPARVATAELTTPKDSA